MCVVPDDYKSMNWKTNKLLTNLFVMRITNDFADWLRESLTAQATKTAQLLLDLQEGKVSSTHIIDDKDAILFINKSVTERGKLSYANKNRIEYYSWSQDEASSSTNDKRIKSKVGRMINKIFSSELLEQTYGNDFNTDVEMFTGLLKGVLSDDDLSDFEYAEKEDIMYWYHEDQYNSDAQDGQGSLGESCMRHDETNSYMEIYESSNTSCKLLLYKDSYGSVQGRALVWSVGGVQYMDRIYYTNHCDIDKFKAYAVKNDIIHKTAQSYANKISWVVGGKDKDIPLIVPVDNFKNYSRFPYIDTFTYGFELDDDCYLTNSREYAYQKHGVLRYRIFDQTDGDWYNVDGTEVLKLKAGTSDFENSICFHGDWVELSKRNVGSQALLDLFGDNTYIRVDCQDSQGKKIITSVNDAEHDGRTFYLKEDLRECSYTHMYFNPEKTAYGCSDLGIYIKRAVCVNDEGVMTSKANCVVYTTLEGKQVWGCGSKSYKFDLFGVRRKYDDLVYLELCERSYYIPKNKVRLINDLRRAQDSSSILIKEASQFKEREL